MLLPSPLDAAEPDGAPEPKQDIVVTGERESQHSCLRVIINRNDFIFCRSRWLPRCEWRPTDFGIGQRCAE